MTEYTFTSRLAILLVTITALAILNTYIPHDLAPIRAIASAIQMVFMLVTMVVTVRWVVEDF
jgi:hypothetical protein